MRTESDCKPSLLAVEEHGESAEVIFHENIEQETRETDGGPEIVYAYDEYRLSVPNRPNLLDSVKATKAEWLNAAKEAEFNAKASEVRKKRNKLLAETDARMCLDRMGLEVPSGTTFSSWLSFLKELGSIISGKWAKYRQALRDIPEQEGFPFNIEWPEQPKD